MKWWMFYVCRPNDHQEYDQAWLQAGNRADAQSLAERHCGYERVYGLVMARRPKGDNLVKGDNGICWNKRKG